MRCRVGVGVGVGGRVRVRVRVRLSAMTSPVTTFAKEKPPGCSQPPFVVSAAGRTVSCLPPPDGGAAPLVPSTPRPAAASAAALTAASAAPSLPSLGGGPSCRHLATWLG